MWRKPRRRDAARPQIRKGMCAFQRHQFGLSALVGESDNDGVSSCFLKCAGQEISSEEGEPGPGDVRV